MARYSATGDKKILEAMEKHFLGDKNDYGNMRDVINVEIMLWVYLHTGNKKLLELAEKACDDHNKASTRDSRPAAI